MPRSFDLEIVTPEGIALKVRATSLQAPAWEGYLGVLPGHAPLICALKPGCLTVRETREVEHGERTRYFAVRGGFMQVEPERVVVLADEIERAEAIDRTRVERELAEIEALPSARAEAEAAPARANQGAPGLRVEPGGMDARARTRDELRRRTAEATSWAKARLEVLERRAAGEQ